MARWFEIRVSQNEIPEDTRLAMAAIDLGIARVATVVVDELKESTPKRSGRTARLWHRVRLDSQTYLARNKSKVSRWLFTGTGIYGPRKRPIQPVSAEALLFKWRGRMTVWKGDLTSSYQKAAFIRWARARGLVPYLVWPRGMRGRDYITPALMSASRQAPDTMARTFREAGVS